MDYLLLCKCGEVCCGVINVKLCSCCCWQTSQTECDGVDADDEGRVRELGGGVHESSLNLSHSVDFTHWHYYQFGRQQVARLVSDSERQIIEQVPATVSSRICDRPSWMLQASYAVTDNWQVLWNSSAVSRLQIQGSDEDSSWSQQRVGGWSTGVSETASSICNVIFYSGTHNSSKIPLQNSNFVMTLSLTVTDSHSDTVTDSHWQCVVVKFEFCNGEKTKNENEKCYL